MQKRKPLKTPRKQAFLRQNGRCFYCQNPIWEENPEQYAKLYGLSLRKAQWMRCTGEHLTAYKDGGSATPDNIVAACYFCNTRRHARKKDITPEKYKIFVSKRVEKKRWHGLAMMQG